MSWDREKLVIILLLTSCILLWFYLTYLEDTLYTTSLTWSQTEQQVQKLHNINMALKDQLLEQSSYTTVAKKAKKMGFTPGIFITP